MKVGEGYDPTRCVFACRPRGKWGPARAETRGRTPSRGPLRPARSASPPVAWPTCGAASTTCSSAQVAVKIMRADPDNEEIFAERFRDEALHSAALMHTNITTVFDYGEDDHLTYLVMELVPGAAAVRGHPRAGCARPRTSCARSSARPRSPSAWRTRRGVVHRDVKPANILVRDDGVVMLTDFGIARAIDATRPHPRRRDARHPQLHQPRAGHGPAGHRRQRPLRPRRGRPRDAHRQPPVRPGHPDRDRAVARQRAAAAAGRGGARRPARRRGRAAGEGPRRTARPTRTTSPRCSAWPPPSSPASTSTWLPACRAATWSCRSPRSPPSRWCRRAEADRRPPSTPRRSPRGPEDLLD